MTSTPSMTVWPCKPCSPNSDDVTLKLMGSRTICPMLRFATALEWPSNWNVALLWRRRVSSQRHEERTHTHCEFVSSVSARGGGQYARGMRAGHDTY